MAQAQAMTSNTPKAPDVLGGNQSKYWIEIQFIDDSGNPVANMPYRAENQATRTGHEVPYTGSSDDNGVIRIEKLLPLDLALFIEAQPLADEMEKRPLSVDLTDAYQRRMNPISAKNGQIYYHTVIGCLCDKAPNIPEWKENVLPEFHFPDETFGGLKIHQMHFNSQVKVEICPFRAWNLVLHYQKNYSITNAYNCGLMADLAYSTKSGNDIGSVNDFFGKQCLDLSKIPQLYDGASVFNTVSVDVPFNQRYTEWKVLDTLSISESEGNTQLFYAANKDHLIVSWRGTQEAIDWITDMTYRPETSLLDETCEESKSTCVSLVSQGKVHKGFWGGYNVAKKIFPSDFSRIKTLSSSKLLFICGHSLGGALSLIHATELKELTPVLHTYGMPRVFTHDAILTIEDITHFRHVNDNDLITTVPPEAELDNALYDHFGFVGIVWGVELSAIQLLSQSIPFIKYGDPYGHHGEIVIFFNVTEFSEVKAPGLWVARAGVKLRQKLPCEVKLYLAPVLSGGEDKLLSSQNKFIKSIDKASLDKYFPKNKNPEWDSSPNPMHHSMVQKYLPYLYNQLLCITKKEKTPEHNKERVDFKAQMLKYKDSIPVAEKERNEMFFEMESMLPQTLNVTLEFPGGATALKRFELNSEECNE